MRKRVKDKIKKEAHLASATYRGRSKLVPNPIVSLQIEKVVEGWAERCEALRASLEAVIIVAEKNSEASLHEVTSLEHVKLIMNNYEDWLGHEKN